MKNMLPNAMDPLMVRGGIAADGLQLDGADVGVTHISEAVLRSVVDNAKKKNNEYQDGVSAFGDNKKALDDAFQSALDFAQVTRDHLKPKLGARYSKAWNQVGFITPTLKLPRSYSGVQGLVGSMGLFLEAHPELNVPTVMTPAIAAAFAGAVQTATTNLGQAKTGLRQKKAARDEAMADLRKHLTWLRRELSMLLPANDPRWLSFGFNVPTDLTVPKAPEGLTVVSSGTGRGLVSWNHAVGADRYHIYKQVVGVDTEPVRVATVRETSTDVGGLPSGAHVTFYVTALNAAGESLESQTVTVVIA